MPSTTSTIARRASALAACACALAVAAPWAAEAKTHSGAPPSRAAHTIVDHGRHPTRPPARKPLAHAADVRWGDGAMAVGGARCDAAFRTLGVQAIMTFSGGWVRAWVYDYNTARYVYGPSDWLPGNSWTNLMMQTRFAPMVRAAVYLQYARPTAQGWSYGGEWLSSFTQDDVQYSSTCTF
jgi:hypothetical protein